MNKFTGSPLEQVSMGFLQLYMHAPIDDLGAFQVSCEDGIIMAGDDSLGENVQAIMIYNGWYYDSDMGSWCYNTVGEVDE